MDEPFIPVPPGGERVEPANNELAAPLLCSVCHQPIRPEFYFCPNCGKDLKEKPLSVSINAQISIYALSIITPPLCFLTIKWWHGVKYLKADDPKSKEIGIIAIVLLVLSTAVAVWFLFVLTTELMQSLTGGLLGGSGSGLY
jgi:hypothetical protein